MWLLNGDFKNQIIFGGTQGELLALLLGMTHSTPKVKNRSSYFSCHFTVKKKIIYGLLTPLALTTLIHHYDFPHAQVIQSQYLPYCRRSQNSTIKRALTL
jgi:hypothetical protein